MKKKNQKKQKEQKNKWLLLLLLLLFICIILFLLLSNKGLKPYVIEKGIKVLSATDEYRISVEPYFKDQNANVIDIEGITCNQSEGIYKFYDYSVSEPDDENFVTHTFTVETITPIEYIEDVNREYPYHKYTFLYVQPSLFDYYTGTVFKEKHVSKNKTVNYHDIIPTEDEMAFTEVTWKDKTYKVGVRVESSMKWDGINKKDNGNGTRTVTDKATTKISFSVYAPKEYDGLMTFFNKKGTTKKDFLKQLEYSNKYNKLVKEANENGEKSAELIEMEENNSKLFRLLDPRTKDESEYKNDTFYVMRVSEIKTK